MALKLTPDIKGSRTLPTSMFNNICIANKLAGFNMRATLAFDGLTSIG